MLSRAYKLETVEPFALEDIVGVFPVVKVGYIVNAVAIAIAVAIAFAFALRSLSNRLNYLFS